MEITVRCVPELGKETYRLVGVDVGDPERLLHGVDVGLAQDGGLGQLVGGAGAGEVAGDVEDLGLLVSLRRARRVQGLEADDPLEAVLQAQPLEGSHGVDLVAVGEYLKHVRHHRYDDSATRFLSGGGGGICVSLRRTTLTSLRMRRFLRMCLRTGSGLMLS